MDITPIEEVIPEKQIVIFAPHYDDVLLGLGGYVLELKAVDRLFSKQFHVLQLFSRSNYQTGSGKGNYDTSLERIKFATGRRLIEDLDCLDELFGEHAYRYELLGERECMLRAKFLADCEMEFPHGLYEDFSDEDRQIFNRLQNLVRTWAAYEDTALVFPLAIKEHIDHFITREAGITIAKELETSSKARFYFQEDKPYAGIQTPEEVERIRTFIESNTLASRFYKTSPDKVVKLAFKHYISQVDEVYQKGVLQRPEQLKELYGLTDSCDCIYPLLATT